MTYGPIELVVIGFPRIPTSGRIAEEVQDLIDREVITLVDGLIVVKDEDGEVTFVEIEQEDAPASLKDLADLMEKSDGLLSDEDAYEIADSLGPDSAALMLVFENTWVKQVRNAVDDEGGVLLAQIRVPGPVVEEVVAALAAE